MEVEEEGAGFCNHCVHWDNTLFLTEKKYTEMC